MIRESTESYLSSINSFTSNGGKNFYDIGSIIDIDDINSKNIIKEKIKELQSNGVDIKIIKEKEKDINGDIHSVIALVIPSSQYKEFEKMIVNDLSKNENDFIRFSRRNYFIPPFIRDRDMIATLEDNIPTSKVFETINYNIFCIYGYSTHTIDTSGGYGQFNDGERAAINLYNTIYSSLAHANLYENKNNHINGIMPTLMCFSKDDVKNLAPDNEDKIRKTIVKDLKLYEKEQNIKQTTTLEEEQNKPKNKRLKRN